MKMLCEKEYEMLQLNCIHHHDDAMMLRHWTACCVPPIAYFSINSLEQNAAPSCIIYLFVLIYYDTTLFGIITPIRCDGDEIFIKHFEEPEMTVGR